MRYRPLYANQGPALEAWPHKKETCHSFEISACSLDTLHDLDLLIERHNSQQAALMRECEERIQGKVLSKAYLEKWWEKLTRRFCR